MWSSSLKFRLLFYVQAGAVLLAQIGCSDAAARYQVSGKVLLDGKPLSTGTIRFVPEGGRPFTSTIMADGSFMLSENSLSSTHKTDGVIPGAYRVSVTASRLVDGEADEVEWLAPRHYADFRTSGLQVNIDRPRNDLVINLISQVDPPVDGSAQGSVEERETTESTTESEVPAQ